MLEKRNAEPQTLTFAKTSQHFLARVGSVRQARNLCNLGHRGELRLHSEILRVYPFRGDKSVEGAEPAAPAPESTPKSRQLKRKRTDPDEAHHWRCAHESKTRERCVFLYKVRGFRCWKNDLLDDLFAGCADFL
eukprot:symbB.v1.2.011831.t1/scaffold803.1/size162902/3